MATLNKAQLIGNLGNDPELRESTKIRVVNLSVATSIQWTDKDSGEKKERTEWHSVVAFNGLAGACAQHLKKGSRVYVEGRLQTRTWEDKDGIKRYTTEIIAQDIQFL